MTRLAAILCASALCVLALVYAALFSGRPSAGGMSGHGWFAFALGSGLSLAVAGGLFFLVFRSARSGADERVGRTDDV